MEIAFFYVFCSAIALVAAMTLAYLVLLSMVLTRLRSSHAATYRDLGEPSFFFNNSISHGVSVVRFLIHREYRELHDHSLDRLAEICRTLFVGVLVLFGVAVAAVAVYWAIYPGTKQ